LQSALSLHLSKKGCEEDQSRLAANPTALSGKTAWIVMHPDVEKALVLWVKHMEETAACYRSDAGCKAGQV